jgi:hypothetical protein
MSKKKAAPVKSLGPTFEDPVLSICEVDRDFAAQAKRAVNVKLTLRNWIFGCCIVEYEQRGADRARYGEKLLAKLSVRLVRDGVSRAEERELRRYRQFCQTYPKIREALSPESRKSFSSLMIGPDGPNRETASPEFEPSGKELITRLSFSHFVELLAVARVQPRKYRQIYKVNYIVCEEHDGRRRQPADRHPALHAEGSRFGRVRPGWYRSTLFSI